MSGQYRKHGLRIQYPENWQVNDSDDDFELPFEIVFESPDGAMLTITLCERELDREDILRDYVEGLQQQYDDIELTPGSDELCAREGIGVNALFYCLDFLVTAQVRIYEADPWWIGVLYQAEARDFDRHKLVFDAVVTSFLREQAVS